MVRALRFQKIISTIRLGPDKGCGSAREKGFPSKEEEMQMHAACSEIIRRPVRLEWKGQCWRWMENGAEKIGRGWSGKKADISGGSLGSRPWKGGDKECIYFLDNTIYRNSISPYLPGEKRWSSLTCSLKNTRETRLPLAVGQVSQSCDKDVYVSMKYFPSSSPMWGFGLQCACG